jgi:hypothetical protein
VVWHRRVEPGTSLLSASVEQPGRIVAKGLAAAFPPQLSFTEQLSHSGLRACQILKHSVERCPVWELPGPGT